MTKQLNKKGTSLVELIAVIIIMGIIAGIAIPTTIAVINRQKKNAAKSSANNVYATAQQTLVEYLAEPDPEIPATAVGTGDEAGYTITSAQLVTIGALDKDPFGTNPVTFKITTKTNKVAPTGTAPYVLNGIDLYWNASAAEFTLTNPSSGGNTTQANG